MANPTTNYGFVLPTSSDLVTDLPADFDVALQGVDTRLKALQPGTTLGDLAYSSATANTNTRLAIGSSGQVLTVSSGVPAWSTPAAASGPAFFAYRDSTQSISAGTWTKVAFNQERFDTDTDYDPTTNYRFTPGKAGYYQINASVQTASSANNYSFVNIYKNGSGYINNFGDYVSAQRTAQVSAVIYFNGTTDYVEVYALIGAGTSPRIVGGSTNEESNFNGVWIRA